jgi:hypothetical protein
VLVVLLVLVLVLLLAAARQAALARTDEPVGGADAPRAHADDLQGAVQGGRRWLCCCSRLTGANLRQGARRARHMRARRGPGATVKEEGNPSAVTRVQFEHAP